MSDLDAIKARVGRLGDEPLTLGRQGGSWAIAIFRADSWNHDVLADDGRKEAMLYADLFAHARDDIRALLAEVERVRGVLTAVATRVKVDDWDKLQAEMMLKPDPPRPGGRTGGGWREVQ